MTSITSISGDTYSFIISIFVILLFKLFIRSPFPQAFTQFVPGNTEGEQHPYPALQKEQPVGKGELNACLQQEIYQQEHCTVLGPAPCAVPKINYNFRYQLTLRCRMTRPLRQLLAHLLRQFSQDKMNRKVSAFVAVNGLE